MPEEVDKLSEDLVSGGVGDHAYLLDLTTKSTQLTGHTNIVDWGEKPFALHAEKTAPIQKKVPGLQIDGYFLDNASQTTRAPGNRYGNKKYLYDSQFVIRFPTDWNGRLVITRAPGVRDSTLTIS
jgi:hypothetical protein